jgi:DNA-binding transcriptional ArsR family regulator
MTARTNTSIRLSDDEKRRLLEWGPDVSAAVRRVLAVAEEAWQLSRKRVDDDALLQALVPPGAPRPTTRELVRAKMRPGRTAGDIARMLGMTRQAVQWHMRRIREGA